ncbi:hypothetical protein HanIR_Chr05g0251091 [Helianthus annuus]|nr:hypothetical protein HanIR_Chr05g0251091 [Helianthus annuus]
MEHYLTLKLRIQRLRGGGVGGFLHRDGILHAWKFQFFHRHPSSFTRGSGLA